MIRSLTGRAAILVVGPLIFDHQAILRQAARFDDDNLALELKQICHRLRIGIGIPARTLDLNGHDVLLSCAARNDAGL